MTTGSQDPLQATTPTNIGSATTPVATASPVTCIQLLPSNSGRPIPAPCQAEVWCVNFNPTTGAEIRKVRPAVVLNNSGAGKLPLRIVIPITEWSPSFTKAPWLVQVSPTATNGLSKDSAADTFQVRSVSVDRFVNKIGDLTASDMDLIRAALDFCVEEE